MEPRPGGAEVRRVKRFRIEILDPRKINLVVTALKSPTLYLAVGHKLLTRVWAILTPHLRHRPVLPASPLTQLREPLLGSIRTPQNKRNARPK